jgi:hypothetical protein
MPPNKSKENQIKPRKKACFSLDSLGGIVPFQWVTANPRKNFSPVAHPRRETVLRSPVEFSDMGKLARFLFFVNKMSLNRFCRQLPRVGRSAARRPESVIALSDIESSNRTGHLLGRAMVLSE